MWSFHYQTVPSLASAWPWLRAGGVAQVLSSDLAKDEDFLTPHSALCKPRWALPLTVGLVCSEAALRASVVLPRVSSCCRESALFVLEPGIAHRQLLISRSLLPAKNPESVSVRGRRPQKPAVRIGACLGPLLPTAQPRVSSSHL